MSDNDDTEDLAKKILTPEQYKKNAEARKENEANEEARAKKYVQRILHEPCIICQKKVPDHSLDELLSCMRNCDSHKSKLESWFKANLKIGKPDDKKV